MEFLLIFLGFIFFVPSVVLYGSFSWGYVATIISTWFIIPLYPQFPQFTWLQYAGIMFFINCFVRFSPERIKKEYKDELNGWVTLILGPWLTLLGAWILHLFY